MTNGKIEVYYGDLLTVQTGLEEALTEMSDQDAGAALNGGRVKIRATLSTVQAMLRGRE